MDLLEIIQGLIAEKWILSAVLGYWAYAERAERRENARQAREERDEITRRITSLAEALRRSSITDRVEPV